MSDFHSIDMDITYESVFDDYTDGSESENETERMYIADAFIRCRRRFPLTCCCLQKMFRHKRTVPAASAAR